MIKSVLAAVAALTLLTAGARAQSEDSKDPIKLTLHDWTGQLITTQIMGEVLKKAGLNVEYVQADYLAQFAGLKTGDLHVAMEIWETTGQRGDGRGHRHRQGRESRRDRHAGQGGVVVSRLHEGEVPRPAGLGGAEERLRRGLLDRRDRAQGPLPRRAR